MSLLKAAKRILRVYVYSAVTILVVGVTYVFTKAYLDTPSFLFQLQSCLEDDQVLMHYIGATRGNALTFNPDALAGDSASFSIQIQGECDSAYIKISGIYFKVDHTWKYIIKDTLQVNKCR